MSKYVFKNIDIKDLGKPIFVTPLDYESLEKAREEAKVEESIKEKKVKDADLSQIENKIQEKLDAFEEEKIKRRQEVDEEIKTIRSQAENWAFLKVKESHEQCKANVADADLLCKKKLEEAEKKATEIIQCSEEKSKNIENKTYKDSYEKGYQKGYDEGKEEIERLIGRLNIIISSAIKKRNEILEETEGQLVDLVIIIARKVVKSITGQQKRVVYDNIVESLNMLKGRTEITIRVNMEDLQLTTRHKKDFIEMVESIGQVQIFEDNTVDKGGCIITSEFGSIDARISTQLANIEEQIRRFSPSIEE